MCAWQSGMSTWKRKAFPPTWRSSAKMTSPAAQYRMGTKVQGASGFGNWERPQKRCRGMRRPALTARSVPADDDRSKSRAVTKPTIRLARMRVRRRALAPVGEGSESTLLGSRHRPSLRRSRRDGRAEADSPTRKAAWTRPSRMQLRKLRKGRWSKAKIEVAATKKPTRRGMRPTTRFGRRERRKRTRRRWRKTNARSKLSRRRRTGMSRTRTKP
mmetsp:Transcript_13786/g.51428  ORF Transcript_13786/g.51428 Transcript_13786/m.51428 type:complete len:215 (-) Transcript_13786:2064-2708(-)